MRETPERSTGDHPTYLGWFAFWRGFEPCAESLSHSLELKSWMRTERESWSERNQTAFWIEKIIGTFINALAVPWIHQVFEFLGP